MAIIDFGQVRDVIRNASSMNASRDIGPIRSGVITTNSHNIGDFANAQYQRQLIGGQVNEFVWGVDLFGDHTKVVTS